MKRRNHFAYLALASALLGLPTGVALAQPAAYPTAGPVQQADNPDIAARQAGLDAANARLADANKAENDLRAKNFPAFAARPDYQAAVNALNAAQKDLDSAAAAAILQMSFTTEYRAAEARFQAADARVRLLQAQPQPNQAELKSAIDDAKVAYGKLSELEQEAFDTSSDMAAANRSLTLAEGQVQSMREAFEHQLAQQPEGAPLAAAVAREQDNVKAATEALQATRDRVAQANAAPTQTAAPIAPAEGPYRRDYPAVAEADRVQSDDRTIRYYPMPTEPAADVAPDTYTMQPVYQPAPTYLPAPAYVDSPTYVVERVYCTPAPAYYYNPAPLFLFGACVSYSSYDHGGHSDYHRGYDYGHNGNYRYGQGNHGDRNGSNDNPYQHNNNGGQGHHYTQDWPNGNNNHSNNNQHNGNGGNTGGTTRDNAVPPPPERLQTRLWQQSVAKAAAEDRQATPARRQVDLPGPRISQPSIPQKPQVRTAPPRFETRQPEITPRQREATVRQSQIDAADRAVEPRRVAQPRPERIIPVEPDTGSAARRRAAITLEPDSGHAARSRADAPALDAPRRDRSADSARPASTPRASDRPAARSSRK